MVHWVQRYFPGKGEERKTPQWKVALTVHWV